MCVPVYFMQTMALSQTENITRATITKLFIKLLTIKHFNKITAEQQTMANYMDFEWSFETCETPTFTFSANSTFGVHIAFRVRKEGERERGGSKRKWEKSIRMRFLSTPYNQTSQSQHAYFIYFRLLRLRHWYLSQTAE